MLPVFRNREDRMLPWLQTQLSDMLFTEVPAEYLAGEADLSFMEKVPLPVRKEELYTLSESGLSALSIADAAVIRVLIVGARCCSGPRKTTARGWTPPRWGTASARRSGR